VALFEDPETGLVPLLQRTESRDTVTKFMNLLVEQLFVRESDADERERYRQAIREMADGDAPFEKVQETAIVYLRQMKVTRIERSHSGKRFEPSSRDDTQSADEVLDAEAVFEDRFLRQFRAFFAITTDGIMSPLWGKQPFILSNAFASRLISTAKSGMMPIVLEQTRRTIARVKSEHEDGRLVSAIDQLFIGRKSSKQLAEIWSYAWDAGTRKTTIPEPPEEKTGLFGKLFGGARPGADVPEPQEVKKWETKVDQIVARNQRAESNWAAIVAPDEEYDPPVDDDWELLKRIPFRSRNGLQSQITAITQISVQGGTSSAFNTYQRDKSVDLALLICAYRYPDTFLGEDGFLYDVMRGFGESDRKIRFPLVYRYLLKP